MTKKIFAMFLAVLMVVSMLPTSVFAAGTCPYKGTGLHTAENCDNTVIGEPVAATCNAPGFTAYKCNACGDEFHDNVTPATGAHTWENIGDIAPTCEKPGYKNAKKCSGCGKEDGETRIAPLGEKNGVQVYHCDWVITNPQINCLTGGEQIWKCANCGDEKTVIIDKKAHDFSNGWKLVVEATKDVPGKAERVCKDCGDKEESVVYFDHDCKSYLIDVEAIAMTCTTNGQRAHKECRICGTKYNEAGTGDPLTSDQIAALTIKAAHTYDCPAGCPKATEHKDGTTEESHVATCVDTVLHCKVCDQTLAPNVEHTYSNTAENSQEATCTTSGWKTFRCTSCKLAVKTEIVNALEHHLVTVTVPATCQDIAYTYTYCTRKECKSDIGLTASIQDKNFATNNKNYNVKVDGLVAADSINHAAVDNTITNQFYFGFYHAKLDDTLFFDGTMTESGFMSTTNDVSKAAKVYLELVHNGKVLVDNVATEFNGYRLFFYNAEGVKTYIVMNEYKDGNYYKAKVGFTTEKPADYYTWDDTNDVLLYTTKNASFRFGTHGTYGTIGATESYYFTKDGQVFAKLGKVGEKVEVQLVSYTFDYDAGVNKTNHGANLVDTVLREANCEVAGEGELRCSKCGFNEKYPIAASHDYVPQTSGKLNGTGEDLYKAPGCEAGYQYEICSKCQDTIKNVLPGYGHVMGKEQTPTLSHKVTGGYKVTKCTIVGCTHEVKGEYVAWEFVGKTYDSITDAKKKHPELATTGTVIVPGTCFVAEQTQYYCSGCKTYVVVETKDYGKGMHRDMAAAEGGDYTAPTCTTDGGYYTFLCSGCKQYVGKAPFADAATRTEDNYNKETALGHDMQVFQNHQCVDCNEVDFTDLKDHSKCSRCDHTIKCFRDHRFVGAANGLALCEQDTYEIYFCELHQTTHIRNFVKAMGHEFENVLNAKHEIDYELDIDNDGTKDAKAPSCTETGIYYVQCAICGEYESRVADKVAHENKAGEKFFENCQDKITDRHCKNCCVCDNMGASHSCLDKDPVKAGAQPCDCVISTDCQWNKVLMPSNCSMAPYWAKSCPDCGARENEVVTEAKVYEYVNTAAEGEEPNFEWVLSTEEQAIIHMGHKPAEVDYVQETKDGKLVYNADGTPKMVEKRLPGFTYEEYTYVWYTVVEGKLYKNTDTYTAKFIERKDASYTEEGYDHFVCAICKTEEKNMKAKLSGLGFEFSVENALGGKEFTYGSLIEVTVYANGNNAAVHGFNFNVSVNETLIPVAAGAAVKGAKFVGYEKLNDNFNLIVTNPSKTAANAKVSGFAANTASGKQQNITINGKTELVKLYFRIADKAFVSASRLTAKFEAVQNEPMVTVLKDGESVDVSANTNMLNKDFATRAFLNFNNDTAANTKDLQMAMSMITLEHVDGKTYDVTVDVNKDGVVDLQDLSIAYNYVVGNYDLEELLVMGISDAEVELLDLNEKTFCNSSACGKEIDANAVYCPFCGNHQ